MTSANEDEITPSRAATSQPEQLTVHNEMIARSSTIESSDDKRVAGLQLEEVGVAHSNSFEREMQHRDDDGTHTDFSQQPTPARATTTSANEDANALTRTDIIRGALVTFCDTLAAVRDNGRRKRHRGGLRGLHEFDTRMTIGAFRYFRDLTRQHLKANARKNCLREIDDLDKLMMERNFDAIFDVARSAGLNGYDPEPSDESDEFETDDDDDDDETEDDEIVDQDFVNGDGELDANPEDVACDGESWM